MAVIHHKEQTVPEILKNTYDCKIVDTGKKLIHKASIMYGDPHISQDEIIPVIAIEMPAPEFEKFCRQTEEFMTVMKAIRENPIARKQYEDLLIYSTLLK